jgi:hypothetical protein
MNAEQEYTEGEYLKSRGLHRGQVVSDIRAAMKAWGSLPKLAKGVGMQASKISAKLQEHEPFTATTIIPFYGLRGSTFLVKAPDGKKIEVRDVPEGVKVSAPAEEGEALPEDRVIAAFRACRGGGETAGESGAAEIDEIADSSGGVEDPAGEGGGGAAEALAATVLQTEPSGAALPCAAEAGGEDVEQLPSCDMQDGSVFAAELLEDAEFKVLLCFKLGEMDAELMMADRARAAALLEAERLQARALDLEVKRKAVLALVDLL